MREPFPILVHDPCPHALDVGEHDDGSAAVYLACELEAGHPGEHRSAEYMPAVNALGGSKYEARVNITWPDPEEEL